MSDQHRDGGKLWIALRVGAILVVVLLEGNHEQDQDAGEELQESVGQQLSLGCDADGVAERDGDEGEGGRDGRVVDEVPVDGQVDPTDHKPWKQVSLC